jgi:20S proteasome alpha/beta subunit
MIKASVMQSTFKYKNPVQKFSKMTCIIGGRCSNGVVLAADRKIVDEDTRDVIYRQKIYQYYYPIVVGSSGDIDPFDNFRREALRAAQNIRPHTSSDLTSHVYQISGIISTFATTKDAGPQKSVIDLYPYLEKLSEIIRKYKTRYPPYNFDVILAAQTQEKRAYLEYIDSSGLPSDIYDSYKILGSGNIVANAFLKSVWSKDITMEDFGELCYFIIKYFDKFEIDYTVGLGGMKPQIWFIPDDLTKQVTEADESTLNKYDKNSDSIFQNLKRYGFKKLV